MTVTWLQCKWGLRWWQQRQQWWWRQLRQLRQRQWWWQLRRRRWWWWWWWWWWWCFPKTDRWPGDPDCLWRSHSRSVVRAVCLYHQLLVTQVYQWMCFDLYFSFHKFFSHWPCSKTILQWILSGTHTKGVFLYDKCGSLPFCTNELGWEIYSASGMMPVLQHVKSIMANRGGPFTSGFY